MPSRLAAIFFVALYALLPTPALHAQITPVALSDTHAPGTASLVTFSDFNVNLNAAYPATPPVINNKAQVAFWADLTGPVMFGTNSQGLWMGSVGNLTLAMRQGDQAPGLTSGTNFGTLGSISGGDPPVAPPALNDNGYLSFQAMLTGIGVTLSSDRTLWAGTPGSLGLVAREGLPAPGFPAGSNYSLSASFGFPFVPPKVNSSNQVAYAASVNTTLLGWWAGSAASPTLVAGSGVAAPGMPASVFFAGQGSEPVWTPGGKMAFASYVSGPTINTANDLGIWSGTPGSLSLVAQESSQAPGLAAGITFASPSAGLNAFTPPSMNESGQVVFGSYLRGPGISATNDSGIWTGTPGNVQLVIRDGAAAPGLSGLNLTLPFLSESGQVVSPPVINASGKIAFQGGLTGSRITVDNSSVLWAGTPDNLQLIARAGDQAPGKPAFTRFGTFAPNTLGPAYPNGPVINELGQIAFQVGLSTSSSANGIWATDRFGVLTHIVSTGSQLEIAPGDFRTVQSVSFAGWSGNEDGRPSGFNDLGQITFWASYSGGSGIFISNAVAVPEPTTLALAACGLGMLLFIGRRLRTR